MPTTTDTAAVTPVAVTDAKNKWLASVPEQVSPDAGAELADKALADARAVILAVADRYHGTVPPPPWPATPELQRARERMRMVRDGFAAVARKGGKIAFLPAVRANLVKEGSALYDRAAELVTTADKAPTLPDVLKLIPDPRKLIMGMPVYVAIFGLWWLHKHGRKILAG